MGTFDLNILPIHRNNGQESADLPGLLAVTPPRKTARGREKDNLIVYLMLSGNATFSASELAQLNSAAANAFYQSPGSLTSAMRKSAETINTTLLQRNLSTSGRGQYALGMLVLAALRESQCTLLLSGPSHAVWVGDGGSRHIHDAALSGKGLGSSQSYQTYFSQVELHSNDLLVLCGKFPPDWEADLLSERPPASLDAGYRKLTFTKGDLNAALIQAKNGGGTITVLRPEVSSAHPSAAPTQGISVPVMQESVVTPIDTGPEEQTEESPVPDAPISEAPVSDIQPRPIITEEELDELADFAAHLVQPSAYAIPPQPDEINPPLPEEEDKPAPALSATAASPSVPRSFPPSIPRATKPVEPKIEPNIEPIIEEEPEEEEEEVSEPEETLSAKTKAEKSNAHAEATRQMAKVMVSGIQTGRRVNEHFGSFLQRFIPRLLPGAEEETQQQKFFIVPTYAMVFIAVVIPVIVVTIASVIYLRYGQSVQYDELYSQALTARAQAISETDPARQRQDWQNVLDILDKADTYRQTDESKALRADAQKNNDQLMGVVRLEFVPAFTNGIGNAAQISRMAASESDLYMLNAEGGNIMHASFTGRTLELDGAFNCQPGTYAGYQVGELVDLLALPKVNAVGANVLGIDATGNLLYCSPGQVPQAFKLPDLPNTNWGRITSFALDNGNLYVLDATSRSVWVFVGDNGSFNKTPYFYFGTQIPNTIDTAIDLSVSGDDLYLLHADGHMSTCTFSRINDAPTRCNDPATIQDPFPAHKDVNVFANAHFTQMSLTSPPTPVILLLDSENQSVFRFSPRTLELLNQIRSHTGKGNPFQSGQVGAMAVSPNYVLYLAIGDQVYFATNLP